MLRLIDRLLIYSYVKSYLICFVSLLGLYIVVDLFNNIDDFTRIDGGLWLTVRHVARYYGAMVTVIFDRLSEAIVLLAAMFTVAWVQRNNELLPMLSAGVSTRRVLRPVLTSACCLVFLNVANQELLIPRLDVQALKRDDPDDENTLLIYGNYDTNGIFITGETGVRKDLLVTNFTCLIPPDIAVGTLLYVRAAAASYVPPANEPWTGGWRLTGCDPPELPQWNRTDVLEQVAPGEYFLYTDRVDFERLATDTRKWWQDKSLWDIYHELHDTDSPHLNRMAVFFHMRLTRPILGMLLVVMGLSVILRDQNRNVFISAGMCLVLCAVFFTTGVLAKYLGDNEMLSPAMAAWLPVFLFGPLAFVLFDAVHT